MKTNLKRILSAGLALAMGAACLPTALAASESRLSRVTASFIDAENGSQLTADETYSVTHEEKSPQGIADYTYSDYTESVEHVYSHKDLTYIIGYPDGGVRAENPLTRAEAATIFYRLYDGEYPDFTRRMSNSTFADVKTSNWFYKEVETLYNAAIAEGRDTGRFAPDEPVTRAEFAVLAARFSGLKYKSGKVFSDVPDGHWAHSYINAAADAGWVKGYPDGTFRPDKIITRAEAVTLVNGMINRSVTLEQLTNLGVRNPYNDLAQSYWAYCDILEATVSHSEEEWHGVSYNDGEYNVIIEKYVDENGRPLAGMTTRAGKPESVPKAIPAYEYRGYIRTITYKYVSGDARPAIEKTANVKEASVGDILTYTVKLSNDKAATSAWKSVVLTDKIPSGLTFVEGSVYVDGRAAEHTLKNETLSIKLGDIAAGKTVSVTFKAKINVDMYNQTIYNTAAAKGTNGFVTDKNGKKVNEYTDKDDGVYVKKGDTMPYIVKSADKTTAKVGERITYTVTLGNRKDAVYQIENAVLSDKLPAELDFIDGSVLVDGKTTAYAYDRKTGRLSVTQGAVAPAKEHTISFAAIVNETAYGKTIYNVAVLSGDNIPDTEGKDAGVEIPKGDTQPYIVKSADRATARVGDRITYTVRLGNSKGAVYEIENAVFSDTLPSTLGFIDGSVQADGRTVPYSYDAKTGTLRIELGSLAPETESVITFAATVNESAYGKTVYNTAVLSGENIPDTEDTDGGVTVGDGKARPSIDKTVDKATAKVGDRLTYTITLRNSETASVPVENAVVTDVLPAGLTFEYGSVMLNGSNTTNYTYDQSTRLLTVNAGNIALDGAAVISFVATVNEAAYNTTIQNLATLTSDNTEPVQDRDDGVVVADGLTALAVTKAADRTSAKVGDQLTYTVEVSNGAGAQVNVRDAVMTDAIPEGLTFFGSVTVDGCSAAYRYDNGSRQLAVPLDGIAPGQTKTVCFDVVVNSDAYGKTITNTAVASGSNAPERDAADEGVTIADGVADGHVGTKSADKRTAKVGDTVTYSVYLSNGAAATADWSGMTVTDEIPEGVTFAGNVQADGRATTDYSYDAAARTLTLLPAPIAPDTQAVYSFDVTVDEGSQGRFIVNTAILHDGADDTPMPDAGVSIDEGEAKPIVNKSASVSEAEVGDTFTYTITATNGDKATAAWKNVVLDDILPAGVRLVGGVYLNNEAALYSKSGNALSVLVGDLLTGETATVRFDVQVQDSAAGTTLTNIVTAIGDNGHAAATDGGVTVPPATNGPDGGGFYVIKTADKTVVDVNKDASDDKKTATFTVTVGNDSREVWKNVVLKDVLDSSIVTPVLADNVYLDGVRTSAWSFSQQVFALELGDIAPGEKHEVTFSVRFKSDAAGQTYINMATGDGDNGNASDKAPEIEVVGSSDPGMTDIHYLLFNGYGNGEWQPGKRISLQEACAVCYRLISNGGSTWLPRGTVTVPEYPYNISEEAKYFVSVGLLPRDVFNTDKMTEGVDYIIDYELTGVGYLRIWATAAQLNQLVAYVTDTNPGLSGSVSRLTFARLICQLTGRDTDPNTAGYSGNLHTFSDAGGYTGLIAEVSHTHEFYMDTTGHEFWC